jgi:predicted nucleic acid-binding protein
VKLYVLDANAVMRYLQKGSGFERVRALIELVPKSQVRLLISVINRGEVLYGLGRYAGAQRASEALKTLAGVIEPVDVRQEDADAAAILKLRYKLGFADCFAAELALRVGAILVTADPGFSKLGKQIKILALPRHSS